MQINNSLGYLSVNSCERSLGLGKMGPGKIRTNYVLDQLIHGADVVRFIKSRRLEWLGHIRRMGDIRTIKRIADWKLYRLIKGSPK